MASHKPLCAFLGLVILLPTLLGAAEVVPPKEATRASNTPNATLAPHLTFEQRAELSCENPLRSAAPLASTDMQALALWTVLLFVSLALCVWTWRTYAARPSWPKAAGLLTALLATLWLYAAFALPPEFRMGSEFIRAFGSALVPDPTQTRANGLWLAYWRALLGVFPWRAETLLRTNALLSIPALLAALAFYARLLQKPRTALAALVVLAFSAPLLFAAGSDVPLSSALLSFAAGALATEAVFAGTPLALVLALPVLTLSLVLTPFLALALLPRALAAFVEKPVKAVLPNAAAFLAACVLGLGLEATLIAAPWPEWRIPEFGRLLSFAGPLFALALVGAALMKREARLWAWLLSALLASFLVPQAPGFFEGRLLSDTLLVLTLSPLAALGAFALTRRFALRAVIVVPLLVGVLSLPGAAFLAQRDDSLALRLYRFESDWLSSHQRPLSRLYRAQAPEIAPFPDFLAPRGQKPCLRPLSELSKDAAPKGPRFLFVPPECLPYSASTRLERANCLPWQELFSVGEVRCLKPLAGKDAYSENACFVELLGPRE